MAGADLQYIFPYVLFPLASMLATLSFILLFAGYQDVREEFRLFAVSCVALLLWSFAEVSPHILPYPSIVERFSYLLPVSFIIVPLMIQLTHTVLDIRRRSVLVWAAYALASLTIGIAWLGEETFPRGNLLAALPAFSAAIYSAVCFLHARKSGEKILSILPRVLVASGITLVLLLLGIDTVAAKPFAFLSLSFVPVLLISTGLATASGNDTKPAHQSRTKLLSLFILTFVLLPVLSNLIFIFYNFGSIYAVDITSWLFHRTAITLVSLAVAGVFAFLSFSNIRQRTEVFLYTVICLLACILNFRDLIITCLPEHLSRQIIPINDIFLVSIIGICGHMTLVLTRNAVPWKIAASYGAGLLVVPVTLYEACLGRSLLTYDPVAYKGLGHFLFLVVFLIMLIINAVMLHRERMTKTDPARRKILAFVLSGILSIAVLLSGSMITVFGLGAYPFYSLNFISLALVGYGIFYRDIQRINVSTRRQFLSSGLRFLLAFVYILIIIGIAGVLKGFSSRFIIDSIIPYGIPPLLSFAIAAFLSLFVLGLEKNRPESQLFSLICFCYSLLNLDICLLGIIRDSALALLISRIDHFFLALLMLGVNLHLVYLVIGKKDKWWIVYAGYLIGLAMAPLSQTDYYFQGVYRYSWGFFAHKAILYDIMSSLWGAGIGYGIYLLVRASRKKEIHNRKTVNRVLFAFIVTAIFSLSNNPAMYGYDVYPLGTFIFVALLFLAYGLFKFNIKMALQYVRTTLYWTGLIILTLVTGLAPGIFLDGEGVLSRVFIGTLLIAVLYHPLRRIWGAVLNLFIRRSSDFLKESYYRLTNNLSRIHHRDKIHRTLGSWFFEVLEGSCFISVYAMTDLSGQKMYYGWKTWNKDNEDGLFGGNPSPAGENSPIHIRKDHPLIGLCKYEQTIYTQESLLKMNPSIQAFNGTEGLLKDTEIVIPIISRGVLLALLLLGRKADGSPYSRSEFDILHNISLVLGPHIENAFLMEELEEKVDMRTKELNHALKESVQKEKEIRENSDVITRQNQIFRTLLETSTRIHQMESLDDLFSFILSQLRTLFTDFRGGIILENKRRNILEATSFIGISEIEQKVIFEMRDKIMEPEFGKLLSEALIKEGVLISAGDVWTIFPMEGRSSKVMGYMIFKGQAIDRLTKEIFTVFLGQLSAVTQNKLLMIQLERMASTDGLTGLYNRAFLNQELTKVILHAKRFKHLFFSIMVVDLNGLKKLNDTYGHEKGDEAIIKVAHLLKTQCRTTDIVSRLGGDEFAILMPSTNNSQAEILYDRIVKAAKSLSVVVSRRGEQMLAMPVHISVGLASSDDIPPDEVMKKADSLMYADKERFYAVREITRS